MLPRSARSLLLHRRLATVLPPRAPAAAASAAAADHLAVHGRLDHASLLRCRCRRPAITMGKKKNAKKLSQPGNLPAAPAAAGNNAHIHQFTIPPTTASLTSSALAPGAPPPAPLPQGLTKSQKKRERKKRRKAMVEQDASHQADGGQQPQLQNGQPHPQTQAQDPRAYFASAHNAGGQVDQLGQAGFVGQPLLDALTGNPQPAKAGQAAPSGRKASLVSRPAAGSASDRQHGPPAGAPTGPKAGKRPRNDLPPGVPTQPRGHAGAGSRFVAPPSSQPATFISQQASANNPYGYDLKNASWDWNSFNGFGTAAVNSTNSNAAASSSMSAAPTSALQTNSAAPYWSGSYGAVNSFNSQSYNTQQSQYGQAPDGGVWLQQQERPNLLHQSSYSAGYHGSHGVHHIHGHTNAFAPYTPTTSVNHYYQGHSWRVDKHSSVPNRGFATKTGRTGGFEQASEGEAGERAGPRRSRRLASKWAAEPTDPHSFEQLKSPSSYKFRSPSPRRKWQSKIEPPPRPSPTEEYLRRASAVPEQLSAPQRLLIIMDLNGTLVHRPNRKKSSQIILRPYANAFLKYLLANHSVMVWSSARPENVSRMCAQLFSPAQRAQLLAEWGRDTLGLTPVQYNEKVQVYKVLAQVWRAAELAKWHPQHADSSRFGQHNTLLIDDSMLKASSEPHNLVQVDEFEGTREQLHGADVLRQVVGYLEHARWMRDVSAWVASGAGRFALDKGWDWTWPKGAKAGVAAAGVPEVTASSPPPSEVHSSSRTRMGGAEGEEDVVLGTVVGEKRSVREEIEALMKGEGVL